MEEFRLQLARKEFKLIAFLMRMRNSEMTATKAVNFMNKNFLFFARPVGNLFLDFILLSCS